MNSRLLLVVLAAVASASAAELGQKRNLYSPHAQVTNLSEGISWPKGQALPVFATPAAILDCIEVQGLSPDERITFSALQGQVNRKQPRIYLSDGRSEEGRDTWANTPTIAFKPCKLYTREARFDLVTKYAGEVEGLVLYDPSLSPHYRNLAGTVAGVRRALPVTPEIRDRLQEHGIDLRVLVDLTGLKDSSPLQIYERLFRDYWAQCEKRLIVSARPTDRGDLHHTRDLAVASGAAIVWLDGRVPAERELMRKFLGDMKAGEALALGWYATERSGITTASEFGIGTVPADFYLNATVYAGTDHYIRFPSVPKMPALTNKVYVAIFLSDGDNIQYAQHALRRIWDRAASVRGRVPLNWTISPALVDIGPGILNYYYTTATSNDCFVCGPSGLGYMMPFNTLTEPGAPVGIYTQDRFRMDGYARLTETYLQRAGLRVVTIWDQATPMQRASYAENCRHLYGATVQNFRDVPSVQGSVENSRLRFDKFLVPYGTTYAHLRRALADQVRGWDGSAARFLSCQASIWGEMKPARIAELMEDLGREFPGKVEFVRADHYFNLYNQANGLPFNLLLSPRTVGKGGSSSGSPRRAPDRAPAPFHVSPEPATMEFDFGEVCEIIRYALRQAGVDGMSRDSSACTVTVQARANNDSWSTIDVARGTADVELPPVKARFVRITMSDAGAGLTPGIPEVEIFGNRAR